MLNKASASIGLLVLIGEMCQALSLPTITPKGTASFIQNSSTPRGSPFGTTPAVPSPTSELAQPPPGASIAHFEAGRAVIIESIRMVDATTGWAIASGGGAGDHVVYTGDGGETWRDATPPEPESPPGEPRKMASAYFLEDLAWVAYYTGAFTGQTGTVIWRTRDRGNSWRPSALAAHGGIDWVNLHFVDSQHGWVMIFFEEGGMNNQYVALYRTSDGGETWEFLFDPSASGDIGDIQSCPKTGMAFEDPATGWVARDCHGLYDRPFIDRTEDGGRIWQSQELPPPEGRPDPFSGPYCGLTSLALLQPQVLRLAMECILDYGPPILAEHYLYATDDGGMTWRAVPYPGGSVQFVNADVGWALGREIYQTRDGGQTWTKVKTVGWDGQFDFVNEEVGWAVARFGEEVALVKTTDGGRTWLQIQPRSEP